MSSIGRAPLGLMRVGIIRVRANCDTSFYHSAMIPAARSFASKALKSATSVATSSAVLSACASACVAVNFASKADCKLETCEMRSEEHTSELQSRENLVCRLLLEKKKNKKW